jgi:antitoxin SocA-like protein
VAGRTEFDSGKFKELVLLLADRSKGDPLMSRVKLNKLLYRVDFESFRLLGRSVTGATYVRGEHGPMASELPRAEHELGQAGHLRWEFRQAGPYTQKVPIAMVQPDTEKFSAGQLAIVGTALGELSGFGGKGASVWSHEESAGWRLKGDGEEITYESGLIDTLHPLDNERLSLLRGYVATLNP